ELMGGDGTEVSGVERTEVMTDAHAEVVPGERTEITGSLNTEMPAAPLSSGATNLAVGDIIDKRFVLAQELGRGGMSRVYRAKDLIKERAGDANPYVALKILSGDFSLHPDAWIALQQEISKTQSLAHPRIVTVHDFKIDSDLGLPFAQMEEMRGESLEEVINRHPEGLEDSKRVQEIIMALAEGLGYAHSRGIVHADLKPSNVFVTEEGDIKLLDFGIARFIPGKQNKGGRGEVFGEGGLSALTPTYASPEMFAGEAPLPADDLYALGVIAVELGSGKHPFDSVLGSPQPAVAAADAGLVPQRFPGLTAAQWRAVSGCLKADRTLRPEDGDQFLTMFRPKSAWLRALTVLSVVLAITVVVVWVRAQQKRPDTPFEELPVDLQVRIEQFLDLGNEALSYRDVNGALEHFADAYRLHPKNARAIDGHEEVVELIADSPLPETAGQLRRRQQQAEAMLAYPALEDSGELKSYIQTLSDLEVD
ncbi:MAG: serine/threonine protein kinase, partial [Halieaceae bacterium]